MPRLIDIVHRSSYDNWNWAYLSANPNITLQDVLNNPGYLWSYRCLALNPNITMDDVLDHPAIPWDILYLAQNPNITIAQLEEHLPRHLFGDLYFNLSGNVHLTIQDVLKHNDKPWAWKKLSRHVNITLRDMLANPQLPWDWEKALYNPNMTIQDCLHHPEMNENLKKLQADNMLFCRSIQDVLDYPKLSWGTLPPPDLTMKHVLEFAKKGFYWDAGSHPNIQFHDILEHPELFSDWNEVSGNPNIVVQNILDHPEKPWNFHKICRFANIQIKDMLNNPDIPWYWNCFVKNTHTTIQNILDYSNKLQLPSTLSEIHFSVENESEKRSMDRCSAIKWELIALHCSCTRTYRK
jgi:hypothetical protein